MNLDCIIEEAKCCAGKIGAEYAEAASFGEQTEELFFKMLTINSYIRTLCRNQKTYKIKKEVKTTVPEKVSLADLIKGKSFLYLKAETKVVCTKTEIDPCLSDDEICILIEKVKYLCSNCNCNCN